MIARRGIYLVCVYSSNTYLHLIILMRSHFRLTTDDQPTNFCSRNWFWNPISIINTTSNHWNNRVKSGQTFFSFIFIETIHLCTWSEHQVYLKYRKEGRQKKSFRRKNSKFECKISVLIKVTVFVVFTIHVDAIDSSKIKCQTEMTLHEKWTRGINEVVSPSSAPRHRKLNSVVSSWNGISNRKHVAWTRRRF